MDIKNCVVQFKCPKKWDALIETSDKRIRHCPECDRDVHYCNDEVELKQAIGKNWCVAMHVVNEALDDDKYELVGDIIDEDELSEPGPSISPATLFWDKILRKAVDRDAHEIHFDYSNEKNVSIQLKTKEGMMEISQLPDRLVQVFIKHLDVMFLLDGQKNGQGHLHLKLEDGNAAEFTMTKPGPKEGLLIIHVV